MCDFDEHCGNCMACAIVCGCYGDGEWDEDYEDTATRDADWELESAVSVDA